MPTMASNDFSDWYHGIPQITRYWFTGSVVLPMLGKLGVLSPMWLIFDLPHIWYKFQVCIVLYMILECDNDSGEVQY